MPPHLGVRQELLVEGALLLGRPGADGLLRRQLSHRVVHARIGGDEALRRALRGVQQLRGDLRQNWQVTRLSEGSEDKAWHHVVLAAHLW